MTMTPTLFSHTICQNLHSFDWLETHMHKQLFVGCGSQLWLFKQRKSFQQALTKGTSLGLALGRQCNAWDQKRQESSWR